MNSNGDRLSATGGILPPGIEEAFGEFKYDFNESEMKALDVVNAALLSRQELWRRQLDPRRDVNAECGFPDTITIQHYKEMWEREAVAARAVQCFSQESWQVQPSVYEDEDPETETEFESAWDELGKSLQNQGEDGEENCFKDEQGSPIWSLLARADELSGIGTFGVILLGFADGEDDLTQPLKKGKGKQLLYASAFDESLVQIASVVNDKTKRRNGRPLIYNLQVSDLDETNQIGVGVGVGVSNLTVHASRIIHLADTHHTASSSEVFAVPRMKAVFNNLLGLRKLYAGSPEMYWKGAFPGYSWESHPSLGSDVKINRTKFRDQMEQFMNGLQRYTANIGGGLKTLSPMVVDPTQQINVQIEAICIKLGIPKQVFIGAGSAGIGSGKETESLTGTWNGRIKGRQQTYITPKIITPFVNRLVWAGVLPKPTECHVEWPELETPTPASKAQVALTITQSLVAYVSGGLENLMTPADYLTRVCGFEDEAVESILENTKEHLEMIAPDSPDEEYIPGHIPSEEEGFEDEEGGGGSPPEPEGGGFGGKVANFLAENCKQPLHPGPCADPGSETKPVKSEGKKVTGTGDDKQKDKGSPGESIKREVKTAPPPGKNFNPDVEEVDPKTGVTKTARVGVGGMETPPEPPVPQLPNLTKHERAIETEFRDAYHKDPDGAAKKFLDIVKSTTKPGDPPTFGTDDAKVLHSAWSGDMPLEQRSQNRATLNNVLHQTANAITKRAFVQHLDTLQKGDNILVTVGGCAAGKGYALKQVPEALEAKKNSKAVWDSAGDQNATENPWIQQEAEKRGLKVTYMYVESDPKTQWAHPERGAVQRAKDPSDGRMVDAQVYADSHVIGAKNHHEFHQRNKDNKNARFIFLKSGAKVEKVDGISKESLSIDRHELAQFAIDTAAKGDAPAHIKRGALSGVRLWGAPKSSKAVANEEWVMNAKDSWPGWKEAEEEDVTNHNFMAQYANKQGYPLKSKNEEPVSLNDDGSEKSDKVENYDISGIVENVFCKTGDGGGVDPTCSPKRGGAGIPSIYKKKSGDVLHAATYDKNAKTYKYADGSPVKTDVYIPPTWKNVYVNKDPNGNLLAEGQDEKGKFQPRYGKTHTVKTAAAKFGNVSELRAKQDAIKAEMIKDSKNPIHKENADVLRVIQHLGIRPGGNQTDAEFKSYGAVTLEGRHVKTIRGKTVLRFVPGKSHGKEKTFEVRDPAIASMLKDRAKLAGSTGKLFDTDSKSLAAYAKSKDGGRFKAKDHRTVLGTDTAVAVLDGMKRAKDFKSYKKAVYEVADRVADILGNTRKVALKHYIDPTVWQKIKPKGVDWNPAD